MDGLDIRIADELQQIGGSIDGRMLWRGRKKIREQCLVRDLVRRDIGQGPGIGQRLFEAAGVPMRKGGDLKRCRHETLLSGGGTFFVGAAARNSDKLTRRKS